MTPIKAIAMKKEKGFTLIELVMVIVILGILAAFALPRFADLGGDARAASVKGAAGAVRSAAAIAHSAWLADGGAPATISLDGVTVAMVSTGEGYPASSDAGIATAAQIDSADYTLASDVFTVTGYTANPAGECQFTYSATTGQVTNVLTDGC